MKAETVSAKKIQLDKLRGEGTAILAIFAYLYAEWKSQFSIGDLKMTISKYIYFIVFDIIKI